ncbi:hypothetical protein [Parasitella parasitica]|uniref:Tc1-like transposase DDE domain-containing protein n=1 Tax=Parasitella parasitica TaxID=35722 RepID=A0A0B7N5P5_9FUNG|nr:hypothetical protein [Parasitella parasitica]
MKISVKIVLLISAYKCIALLATVSAASNSALNGPAACLPINDPCGIGVDGFNGAKCCKGTFCVAGACKVLGNISTPPKAGKQPPHPILGPHPKTPNNPLLQQACREKLKGSGCGDSPIDAIGQFCVCQCSDIIATSEKFASSCIPTREDRIKLIRSCREYKIYGRASTSKINYDKSLAFSMHGGKMESYFGVTLRPYAQQKMKRYDYSSPSYIRYLGYPIFISLQQRDSISADFTTKIKAEMDFFINQKSQCMMKSKSRKHNHLVQIVARPSTDLSAPKKQYANSVRNDGYNVGAVSGHNLSFLKATLDGIDKDPEMKGYYFVIDNPPVHSSTDLGKYVHSRGCQYAYLPPYSTELNPIEQFWSVVKSKVKRNKFWKKNLS